MEVQQVRDEVLIFLRAGHESTSAALTFTLHLLHDEIDAVLDWRPPTVDDAPALDRSAMVIKEAMRLYPPAYAVGRQAESDRQIGAYTIPGRLDRRPQPIRDAPPSRLLGQPRGVQPYLLHTRTAKPRGTPYADFPVGAGPRACIGSRFATLEAIIAAAVPLQRFRIHSELDDVPLDTQGTALRPKGAVRIRLAAR
jgi:cytochrome P450